MKEINDIKATDLKALAQLDKDCIDLHLFPPPKTFIQMDVEGPNGEKVLSRKMRSQSWNRNAYNLILQQIMALNLNQTAETTGYGAGKLGLKTTGGGLATTGAPYYTGIAGNIGAAGDTTKGIVVGINGANENFDDSALFCPLSNGSAIACSNIPGNTRRTANTVNQISISPDGQYMFQGNYTNSISVSKLSNDTLKVTEIALPAAFTSIKTNTHTVFNISWSPDSNYVCISYSYYVKVFKNNRDDTFTEVLLASNGGGSPAGGTFSPNGDYLAMYTTTTAIKIYKNNRNDTFTDLGNITVPATGGFIYSLLWGTDKYLIVPINVSPWVKVIRNNFNDTFTALTITFTSIAAGVYTLAWNTNKNWLVLGTTARQYVYSCDVATDTFTAVMDIGCSSVYGGAAFSRDTLNSILVVVSATSATFKMFKVVGDALVEITGLPSYTYTSCIEFSPSAEYKEKFLFYMGTAANGPSPYLFRFVYLPALSYSAQVASTTSYDAGARKLSIINSRVINNNTAVSCDIKEIGLYCYMAIGSYLMLSRDVLGTPITLPAAYKLTVTYTTEMTFPA